MKLVVDNLHIRNFKSFGDVDDKETIYTVCLNKRGPVLLSGANGSGKTTIVEAIVWCLFGRLSDIHNPGDKIVNWIVDKDCMVKILTADGYEICRTRKYNGKSDLIIYKDGSPIDGGDSTNANAQNTLNKIFNLDFNIFVTSMFFGQSSGSFLSIGDSKKKMVIESMFGLNKLNYCAKIAQNRINKCDESYKALKEKILNIDTSIKSMQGEIVKYNRLSTEFESTREETIKKQQAEIDKLKKDRLDPIDTTKLKSLWNLISDSESKVEEFISTKDDLSNKLRDAVDNIAKLARTRNKHNDDITIANRNINHIKSKYVELENKKGKICPTCEQTIPDNIIDAKILKAQQDDAIELKKYNDIKEGANNRIIEIDKANETSNIIKNETQDKISKIDINIKKLQQSIEKAKFGKMTITEANKHNEIISNTDNTIIKYQKLIDEERQKNNNYKDLINGALEKIKSLEDQKVDIQSRCEIIANEASHLTYIYKAHSDKKNLRSFLISESIPILNNRLSYYFNELEVNTDIEFNNMLQIKSSRWPYELHSGGEKKRIDLAMMCALYDTFVSIYGQQSNILVLDELDSAFDTDGVDEYVRLVIDDLSNRIDTILVISHKDEINYAFPTQIKLKKENDISSLE